MLPPITLRCAAVAPPMVAVTPPVRWMLLPALPIALPPCIPVPKKLPWTCRPPAPAPVASRPWLALPETTLRASAVVPPTSAFAAPTICRPTRFACALVPSLCSPIQLPWIVAFAPVTRRPRAFASALKPLITKPRTVTSGAATSTPIAPAPADVPTSQTIGRRGVNEVQRGWVCASRTSGWVIAGSGDRGRICVALPGNTLYVARRPGTAEPYGIMNTTCSMPAVRPACARSASPPSALALAITCRSEPAPESRLLTTVAKLNPKSTPDTWSVPRPTVATACAVPVSPDVYTRVAAANAAPDDAAPGSATRGSVPPTWSVTSLTAPAATLVRYVSTGSMPGTQPPRLERTVPPTTRTW